jgi:hypothetical protein
VRAIAASLFAALLMGLLAACATTPGATVHVLAGSAELDGSTVDGSASVTAGDVISVEPGEALVEIRWSDGSFTRLAGDTVFEVGGDGVRGTLESGTAWNTVGPGAIGYAVGTDDGSVRAAVSSSFAVRCGDGCDGVAASGTVTLDDDTVVTAPASFDLTGGEPVPAAWDVVYADSFGAANAERDAAAGFPAADDLWVGRGAGLASLSGVFEGTIVIDDQSCTGWAEECARVANTIFVDDVDTYTFAVECDNGGPCRNVLTTPTTLTDGTIGTRTVELAFDGEAYTQSSTFREGSYCFFPDGSEEGRWINPATIRLVPTAAEVRDGVYAVTALRSETTAAVELVEPTTDPSCTEFEYEWAVAKSGTVALTGDPGAAGIRPIAVDASAAPLRPVAGLARPSVLSNLRTPSEAIPTLEQGGMLAAGILVLVLVLAYPSYLLSRVVSDRYDGAVGRRGERVRAGIESRPVARVLLLVLGLVVASLIAAALDPSFGAEFAPVLADPGSIGTAFAAFATNLGSWRLVGTALAAFILFLGVGSLVVRLAGRRIAPGVRMPLAFRWGSLLILVAGVALSRVFDINPGIIFGLVAGLVIADSIPRADKGRLALVSAVFALVVGIGAWIGYGILSPLAAAAPSDLVLVIGTELLSALAIEAIATMPLAFLPILGLDGFVLRGWRVVAWAAVYAIGLALFVLLLFTLPGSWAEISSDDVLRWGIGFGAFTVVAVTVFLIHAGLERRAAKRARGEVEPDTLG